MNKLIKDEIISIEEIEIGDTIDIKVDDTHMFFANEIYTHNSGFNAENVDETQMAGSIRRAQKTHFLMSVAKTQEQKLIGRANISILKARFAQDGHKFTDCIFNNDSLEIVVTDKDYYTKSIDNNIVDDSDNTNKMTIINEENENQVDDIKEKMKKDYENKIKEEKNLTNDATKATDILGEL